MKAHFDMKGMAQYLEEIQQAGLDIDAAAQRALLKGAIVLHTEMQVLVPVDEGDLKANIKIVGPFQDGNFSYVEVGLIDAPKEIAIYGTVQEFGSPSKNIPAQPYFRPSFDRKKALAMRAIRESLKAEGMVE